jgi:hypothetical protein
VSNPEVEGSSRSCALINLDRVLMTSYEDWIGSYHSGHRGGQVVRGAKQWFFISHSLKRR